MVRFHAKGEAMAKEQAGYLTAEEGEFLLKTARATIEERIVKGTRNLPQPATDSPRLKELGAAFVTLQKRGNLRGCIGHVIPHVPLVQCVQQMALAAALEDPRFPPVGPEELPELEYEVSVLSPFVKAADPLAIEVGRHGLYIKRGYQAGLLLPQVATEHRLDKISFLEHVCLKAGLPRHAWRDDPRVELFTFEAQVFAEQG